MEFANWMQAAELEAKRVLGHDNIEWLIGDAKDMRQSYDDGDSPVDYVQQQVENVG